MKNTVKAVLLVVGLVLLPPVFAQDVLSPDRPGFADGTNVVGKGHVQLETGLQYERDHQNGLSMDRIYTPTLFRIGINDSLELRIASDGLMRQSQSVQNTAQKINGMGDSSLGVKWRLMNGNALLNTPNVALITNLDLATGGEAFRADGSSPSLKVVAEWEVADEMNVGVLGGIYSEKNSLQKKYTGTMLSASLSASMTEQWATFIDLSAEKLMTKSNGDNVITMGAGVTYLINRDMQVDFSIIKGLTNEAPKTQFGLGLSIRL